MDRRRFLAGLVGLPAAAVAATTVPRPGTVQEGVTATEVLALDDHERHLRLHAEMLRQYPLYVIDEDAVAMVASRDDPAMQPYRGYGAQLPDPRGEEYEVRDDGSVVRVR